MLIYKVSLVFILERSYLICTNPGNYITAYRIRIFTHNLNLRNYMTIQGPPRALPADEAPRRPGAFAQRYSGPMEGRVQEREGQTSDDCHVCVELCARSEI